MTNTKKKEHLDETFPLMLGKQKSRSNATYWIVIDIMMSERLDNSKIFKTLCPTYEFK